MKCAFGVSSSKFLGFIVHRKGIEVYPAKAKAIQDIESSKTVKQLKSFLGRVSYIHGFIPALFELLEPLEKLLKKDVSFRSGKEQQTALKCQEHARFISNHNITGEGFAINTPFDLDQQICWGIIGTRGRGVEPIHYLSRSLEGADMSNPSIKCHYLALVFTRKSFLITFLLIYST